MTNNSIPTLKLYLSGPISGCTHDEKYGWRREIAKKTNYLLFDPTTRDFTGNPLDDSRLNKLIVEHDKNEISRCDVVVVWWPQNRVSPGTAMEILYAFMIGKTVITINPDNIMLPRWVEYHSTYVVSSVDEALQNINEWQHGRFYYVSP